jgi:hypothetical protein
VAAIDPVSSAFPNAVTHVPTFSADPVAVTVWLYVVELLVVTVTSVVVGVDEADPDV